MQAHRAVWCPANHLAAAPRRWVRLLGMTTRSWPRRAGRRSSASPTHVCRATSLIPSRSLIRIAARSHPDRTGGRRLRAVAKPAQRERRAACRPVPRAPGRRNRGLKRGRVPATPSAKPTDFWRGPTRPRLAAAGRGGGVLAHWRSPAITGHDGRIRADHPVIVERRSIKCSRRPRCASCCAIRSICLALRFGVAVSSPKTINP